MRQNPLDDNRLFNAAARRLDDDLDLPRTELARLDVNAENPLEPLYPDHRRMKRS